MRELRFASSGKSWHKRQQKNCQSCLARILLGRHPQVCQKIPRCIKNLPKCSKSPRSAKMGSFDKMDKEWRRSQGTNPKRREINENCEKFRGRTTIIIHTWTGFWTQIVFLSVESSGEINSENGSIFHLSSDRPTCNMFTLHYNIAISTQKHLGSSETGMREKVVSRTLKSFHWLVLSVEINKDDFNKSIWFQKGCTKLWLHVLAGASENTMCIIAYLQDEVTFKPAYVLGKCSCCTYQAHNDFTEFVSEGRYWENMT